MTAKLDLRVEVDPQGRRQLTHPEAASISHQTLIERARALVPVLRERAARTEAAERLLPETVNDFVDVGFFRIVQPRRFGGFEFGIDVLEEVVTEVGRGCGSSAWTLAILGGHSWLSGLFTEEGQQAIFGEDGHVIMATNLSGDGRCRRVAGGYELSGRFVYLSGCDVANWLCVGAMLEPSADIRGGTQDPPSWFYMALRPEHASIQDDWHVLGLRGTGSKSVLADRVFVPEHLALPQSLVQQQEPPGRYTHANPFYAAPMGAFLSIETTGAAVGIAQQAVEVLEEMAVSKRVRSRAGGGGETDAFQVSLPAFRRRYAEAKSLASAARVLLLNDARRLMSTVNEHVPAGRKHTPDEIAEYGLNAARLVDLCVQAVDHAFTAAGTSATFDGHAMERCFRDIHMLTTHNVYRMDMMAERWSLARFGLSG
jgi:3-hydroxy-9,10-secoandrosta-1,3,5(10)-triene-9,17-dione monooxygenase